MELPPPGGTGDALVGPWPRSPTLTTWRSATTAARSSPTTAPSTTCCEPCGWYCHDRIRHPSRLVVRDRRRTCGTPWRSARLRRMQDECVLWEGPQTKDGYGIAEVGDLVGDGKRHRTLAHRAVWWRAHGDPGPGIDVHHTCETRLCVLLSHLELKPKGKHNREHQTEKTECPRGHPYSEENTYVDRRGWRQCRTCWNVRRQGR